MAIKVIVTKSGFNALTETDVNNQIFNSDYGTLKYHVSGSYTLTVNYANYYGTYTVFGVTFYKHKAVGSIAHGLGYAPFFVAYVDGYAAFGKWNLCPGSFADAGYYFHSMAYCDATNIYFVDFIGNTANSGTFDQVFNYKIFRNNLGL